MNNIPTGQCKNCEQGIIQNKSKLVAISIFIGITSFYGIYKMIKETAQDKLYEGDEVDIPRWLKQKYFVDGRNCAYIQP